MFTSSAFVMYPPVWQLTYFFYILAETVWTTFIKPGIYPAAAAYPVHLFHADFPHVLLFHSLSLLQ